MRIVELAENSMMIMKDSEDPPWVSVGQVYRLAQDHDNIISVAKWGSDIVPTSIVYSSDYICTAGRLILFFPESLGSEWHLQDRVSLDLESKHFKPYKQ